MTLKKLATKKLIQLKISNLDTELQGLHKAISKERDLKKKFELRRTLQCRYAEKDKLYDQLAELK